MAVKGRICPETRAYARLLTSKLHWSTRRAAKECLISKSSVHRISKSTLRPRCHRSKYVRTEECRGRPTKLTTRDQRHLVNALLHLRKTEGNFTANRIMEEAGISTAQVSARTVRRYLNKEGYFLLNTLQKGILTDDDLRKRVAYARRVRSEHSPTLWTDKIGFYLDGVSFVFKTKPKDQARAPKKRVWRKKCEGLKQGCVAKGRKEGTGANVVHMMVAVSYGKGVIICEEYEKMNGKYFAGFITRNFMNMFGDADKDNTDYFLQDGDPSQNSLVAKKALQRAKAKLFPIPARSPDLNPIENVFHLTNNELKRTAMYVDRETRQEFVQRIRRAIYSVPVATIDKTISSMHKRLDLIITGRGQRLKY